MYSYNEEYREELAAFFSSDKFKYMVYYVGFMISIVSLIVVFN